MPERFSPAQPNYLRFVSTPTIDIEPFFGGLPVCEAAPFCGAIGLYSAGGVHRSLLPPEEPPLLPPLSGAGVTTSGVWRRVAEAA